MHTSRRSFVERATGGAVLLANTPWSFGRPLEELEAEATTPMP